MKSIDKIDDQEVIAFDEDVNNVDMGPIDSNSGPDDLNLTTLVLD